MASTVRAGIGGANLSTVADLHVTANSSYDVLSLAFGFSAAGLLAGVGSITRNDLANTTDVFIQSGALVTTPGDLFLSAEDVSVVSADSVALAFGTQYFHSQLVCKCSLGHEFYFVGIQM